MSKQSVYEGLKNAIRYNQLPYHHFEDDQQIVIFESFEQYQHFDRALDTIPTPGDIKLHIYSEMVGDRKDGIAITISDDVQKLTYWQMYPNMESKVAELEELISWLYRRGTNPISFDYYCFVIELTLSDYKLIKKDLDNGDLLHSDYYISHGSDDCVGIHLSFPDWK